MKLLAHVLTIAVLGLLLRPGLAAWREPLGGQGSESAAKDAKRLTGVISDAICGRKHAMAGKSDAECTRECVRRGSQHALIVGDKVTSWKVVRQTNWTSSPGSGFWSQAKFKEKASAWNRSWWKHRDQVVRSPSIDCYPSHHFVTSWPRHVVAAFALAGAKRFR